MLVIIQRHSSFGSMERCYTISKKTLEFQIWPRKQIFLLIPKRLVSLPRYLILTILEAHTLLLKSLIGNEVT